MGPATASRIVLVRHGRSAHVHRGWMDDAGIARWLAAYDAASIRDGDAPPPDVRALAARAGVVVASDLPRAIASAERLCAPGVRVELSPLLREAPPPVPPIRGVRLPIVGWALAVGAYAVYRGVRSRPVPAATTARAAEAAAWLAGLAGAHGHVLAVTHAAFRLHVARALVVQGWRAPRWRRQAEWSAWELWRPADGGSA